MHILTFDALNNSGFQLSPEMHPCLGLQAWCLRPSDEALLWVQDSRSTGSLESPLSQAGPFPEQPRCYRTHLEREVHASFSLLAFPSQVKNVSSSDSYGKRTFPFPFHRIVEFQETPSVTQPNLFLLLLFTIIFPSHFAGIWGVCSHCFILVIFVFRSVNHNVLLKGGKRKNSGPDWDLYRTHPIILIRSKLFLALCFKLFQPTQGP